MDGDGFVACGALALDDIIMIKWWDHVGALLLFLVAEVFGFLAGLCQDDCGAISFCSLDFDGGNIGGYKYCGLNP